MIAALYVETGGVYYGLPDVDPWDEARDARNYAGPWPVVAHPPCARWCRMAGQIEVRFGYRVGDDGGCFAAALAAVRKFGGVLEHPAYSLAWRAFDLPQPMLGGEWATALGDPGWACHVEQGHYGHPLRKPTWLYAVTGGELPPFAWGKGPGQTQPHRRWGLSETQRTRMTRPTPKRFRDELLAIAATDRPTRSGHSLEGTAVNGPIPVGQEADSR